MAVFVVAELGGSSVYWAAGLSLVGLGVAGGFDIGSSVVPEDFAGSIAVDEEGYIYVADVLNQRIRKFAP